LIICYNIPVAGCRLPVAGCRLPVAGCRLPVAGCRAFILDCSLNKQATTTIIKRMMDGSPGRIQVEIAVTSYSEISLYTLFYMLNPSRKFQWRGIVTFITTPAKPDMPIMLSNTRRAVNDGEVSWGLHQFSLWGLFPVARGAGVRA